MLSLALLSGPPSAAADPDPVPPLPPPIVIAVPNNGTVIVFWVDTPTNILAGVVGYLVFRDDGDGTPELLGSSSTHYFVDDSPPPASPLEPITYFVVAYTSAVHSFPSPPAVFTGPACVDIDLTQFPPGFAMDPGCLY